MARQSNRFPKPPKEPDPVSAEDIAELVAGGGDFPEPEEAPPETPSIGDQILSMSHLVAKIHRETRLAPGNIVQIVGIVLNYTLTARQLEQQRPAYPWEAPIETPEAPE